MNSTHNIGVLKKGIAAVAVEIQQELRRRAL